MPIRDFGPLGQVDFGSMSDAEVDSLLQERGDEIRQRLIERARQGIEEETAAEEAVRYQLGEVPVMEQIGSTAFSLPRAAAEQTAGTLKGAGRLSAIIGNGQPRFAPDTESSSEISESMARSAIRSAMTPQQRMEATAPYRAGASLAETAPDLFPTLPGVEESIPSQVSAGVGSVAALAPAALTGPAAPVVAGGMYGLSAGEVAAEDARAVVDRRIAEALAAGEYARAAELERQRFDIENAAFAVTAPIGAVTEGTLGVAGKIRRGSQSIGGIGKKLAEAMVPGGASRMVQRGVRGAIEGAATESAQETSEQILSNVAAAAVYDPDRRVMDGVAESALIGGLTGGVVGGVAGSDPEKPSMPPLPLAAAAAAGVEQGAKEAAPAEGEEDITSPPLTAADVEGVTPPVTAVPSQEEFAAAIEEADRLRKEEETRAAAEEQPPTTTPDAVQEQGPGPGMLRQEGPEVELPEVAGEVRAPEGEAQAEEAVTPPESAPEPEPAPESEPSRAPWHKTSFRIEDESGGADVTISEAFPESKYAEIYGKEGGIITFSFKGPGVSETGFRSVPGVQYEGKMTTERAQEMAREIAAGLKAKAGGSKPRPEPERSRTFKLEYKELENEPGVFNNDTAAVIQFAKDNAGSEKERAGFPKYTVKIDGEIIELKSEKALTKTLSTVTPGARVRVFRNAAKGVTLDFDEPGEVTPSPAPAPIPPPPPAEDKSELLEPEKKAAEEEQEARIVQQTRDTIRAGAPPADTYQALVAQYESQPRLGTRTAESKLAQAYSTPPPLAYLGSVLADIAGGTKILEGTAGNGMLLAPAADNQTILANELDPNRRKRLLRFLGQPVQSLDATSREYFDWASKQRPDRVILNPPFGRVQGKRFPVFNPSVQSLTDTPNIDIAIALNSLEAMAPDGKAVLILGAKTGTGNANLNQATRKMGYLNPEYLELFQKYNVTDFFTLDGSMYDKMGAGWPVDVVVIDGKRPTPSAKDGGLVRPWVQSPRVYTSWQQLGELLNESRRETGGGTRKPGGGQDVGGGGQGGTQGPAPDIQPGPAPNGPAVRPPRGGRDKGDAGGAGAGEQLGGERPGEPVAGGGEGVGGPGTEKAGRPEPVEGGGRAPVVKPGGRPGILGALTDEERKQFQDLRKELAQEMGGASMGVNPQIAAIGVKMAGLLVKAGVRRFAEFARAMKDEVPEAWDRLKYSLRQIWDETALNNPGLDELTRAEAKAIIDEIDAAEAAPAPEPAPAPPPPAVPAPAPAPAPEPAPELAQADPDQPPPPAVEEGNQLVAPYQGQSQGNSGGLVAPKNLIDPQRRALQQLEQETGMTVDQFVEDRLKISPETRARIFSGPQADAVALSIRNIERGSALINSDQTGVGKGRTVAAVLRYARLQGKIPVFVTAAPELYSDMLARDLVAIEETGIKPFPTNAEVKITGPDEREYTHKLSTPKRRQTLEKIAETGKLPEGYNALFTTYHQLNSDVPEGYVADKKGARRRKQKREPKPFGPIWSALQEIAPDSIIVMDEAHLAAGPTSDTNIRFDSVLPLFSGAYYASATYAKRPDNFPLYALKTLIQRAGLAVDEMNTLFARGGLALQQAMTSMLAESGEFVRRQQNWDGVPFQFRTVKGNEERRKEMADDYTSFLLDLKGLSKRIKKAVSELEDAENQVRAEGTEVKLDQTNFSSRIFNLTSQYLLALRADSVVDAALEAFAAGEKPFITINNTMEGVIESLKAGNYPMNFGGLLLRELDKLLEYKVKDPNQKPQERKERLRLEELPDSVREKFESIRDQILETDFGDMPLSPIDHMKRRLEESGLRVAEITARDKDTVVDEATGELVQRPREDKASRKDTLAKYNNGDLDALIVNGTASTGVSAHTDPRFKDQRVRHMLVAQPNPDINQFMQMLGRIMRFGQTKLPKYSIIQNALAAETRFMVMLRRKLASLNANTAADTESDLAQAEGFADDIFNIVGDQVVGNIIASEPLIASMLDVSGYDPEEPGAPGDYARKVTGQFALLPDDDARRIWDEIIDLYQSTIRAMDEAGENPLKANVEDLRAEVVEKTTIAEGTGDTLFDGPVVLEKLKVKPSKKPPTFQQAMAEYETNRQRVDQEYRAWMDASRQAETARIRSMESKESTPAAIDQTRDAFDRTRKAVTEAYYRLGGAYIMEDGSVFVPVGLNLKSKAGGNFTRPSDQMLLGIRNTVRSRMSMPLSQVSDKTFENPAGESDWAESTEDTAERYVISGNLLKGYSEASRITGAARVTNYSMADGSTTTGILMPPNWTPEDMPSKAPRAEANNLDEAGRLLQQGVTIYYQPGDEPKPVITIGRTTGGEYRVRIRSPRSYISIWGNQTVRGAVPGMVEKNGYMTADVGAWKLPAVLSALQFADPNIRWSYDKIEAALDRAIKKTDPYTGERYFNFTTGISNALAHAALKIAKTVYVNTRDMTRAIRAGMAHLRMTVDDPQNADWSGAEAKMRDMLESEGVQFPQDETPTPPEAAQGGVVVESKGRFRGPIQTDTVEEWRRVADEWLSQFGRDLEAAVAHAISANTMLDAATRQFVLMRIIEMAENEIAASTNDIRTMRMLGIQERAAAAAKDSGAIEFGKVGAARANALRQIDWLMPVLSFRNLVREAQSRMPFPDVASDAVRAWLEQAGRRAVAEIREAMREADNVVSRELRQTVRDMGMTWRDIITSSLANQANVRLEIYRRITAHPVLRALSPQSTIELSNLLATAWEKERAKIFRAEFRKMVKLPQVNDDVRARLFRAIPRILRWSNIGLLDNEAFRNALAPEFGVETFDGPLAQRINRMAQDAQAVGGVNRNRAMMQIYETMQRVGGIRWQDVFRDYWYASVLSGIRTHVDSAVNLVNGTINVALASARTPQASPYMWAAYTSGMREAAGDLLPIVLKGELFRNINFNAEQPTNTLEALASSSNLGAKALSLGKYVGRIMVAIDHLNNLATQQAMMAWSMYRQISEGAANQLVNPTPADVAAAEARAQAEGTAPGLMTKRVREILQETVPTEVALSARDIGQAVAFQNKPFGLAGGVYQAIQRLDESFVIGGIRPFKIISGTQFARFALNYTNEILNYVPPVALMRYYQSAPGRQAETKLALGPEERELILMKAAIGTVMGALAAVTFLGDDDEGEKARFIDITGSFKSLDPKKRRQLLSEGRQPYSIRIGDTYISYRQMGFGGVLGAIGELRDRQLFEPEKWTQETIAGKVADAAAAGMFIVRDSSALTGLTEIVGVANAYKYSTDDLVQKTIPRWAARLAGSVVPNIAKEIDAWTDPAIYQAKVGHEFFVQQIPYFRRELGEGPILNVLGEPVEVQRFPWSRWIKGRKADDKAWTTLGELASRGVFMPVPGPASITDRKTGKRRPMTPAEEYAYFRKVGTEYRKLVEQNSRKLLKMRPMEAAEFLDDEAAKIRREARGQ